MARKVLVIDEAYVPPDQLVPKPPRFEDMFVSKHVCVVCVSEVVTAIAEALDTATRAALRVSCRTVLAAMCVLPTALRFAPPVDADSARIANALRRFPRLATLRVLAAPGTSASDKLQPTGALTLAFGLQALDAKRARAPMLAESKLRRAKARVSRTMPTDKLRPEIKHRCSECTRISTLRPRIVELDASMNNMRDPGLVVMAQSLAGNTFKYLRVLNVMWNALSNGGAEAVGAVMKSCAHLAVVNVGFNVIKAKGGVLIGAALPHAQALEKLILGRNQLGDEGIAAVARGIGALTRVNHLDVSANDFGDEAARALRRFLPRCKMLSCLDCKSNPRLGESGVADITALVEELPHLTELDIAGTSPGPRSMEALALAAYTHTGGSVGSHRAGALKGGSVPRRPHYASDPVPYVGGIVDDELREAVSSPQRLRAVAAALRLPAEEKEGAVSKLELRAPRVTRLRRLSLAGITSLDAEGLMLLSCALPCLPGLTALDLSDFSLGNRGQQRQVLAAISELTQLQELDLSRTAALIGSDVTPRPPFPDGDASQLRHIKRRSHLPPPSESNYAWHESPRFATIVDSARTDSTIGTARLSEDGRGSTSGAADARRGSAGGATAASADRRNAFLWDDTSTDGGASDLGSEASGAAAPAAAPAVAPPTPSQSESLPGSRRTSQARAEYVPSARAPSITDVGMGSSLPRRPATAGSMRPGSAGRRRGAASVSFGEGRRSRSRPSSPPSSLQSARAEGSRVGAAVGAQGASPTAASEGRAAPLTHVGSIDLSKLKSALASKRLSVSSSIMGGGTPRTGAGAGNRPQSTSLSMSDSVVTAMSRKSTFRMPLGAGGWSFGPKARGALWALQMRRAALMLARPEPSVSTRMSTVRSVVKKHDGSSSSEESDDDEDGIGHMADDGKFDAVTMAPFVLLLPSLKELRKLSLRAVSFTALIARHTARALPLCWHLQELDISENRGLDGECLSRLFKALFEGQHPPVKVLTAEDCSIDASVTAALSKRYTASKFRRKLTKLVLSNNRGFDAGAAESVCAMLTMPDCAIEHLSLSSCTLRDEGATTIAAIAASATSPLRYLDVSGNFIRHEGAMAAAAALKQRHCQLTELHIGTNDLGSVAVKHMVLNSLHDTRSVPPECASIGRGAIYLNFERTYVSKTEYPSIEAAMTSGCLCQAPRHVTIRLTVASGQGTVTLATTGAPGRDAAERAERSKASWRRDVHLLSAWPHARAVHRQVVRQAIVELRESEAGIRTRKAVADKAVDEWPLGEDAEL